MRYIIRKNGKFYCERESYENALWELEAIARIWRHNGGIVIEHNDRELIVTENNQDIVTTFTLNIVSI
jgi:hypothetical protein